MEAPSKSKILAEAKLSLEERRKREIEKAQAVLKKAQRSKLKQQTCDISDKENINMNAKTPLKQNASTINISDCVRDETIHLKLDDSSSEKLSQNISFEPNDFTARSTLYTSDESRNKRAASMSVSDILLTSCAPKMREIGARMRSSSAANSTLSSCNGNLSLPRTADHSRSNNWDVSSKFSFGGNATKKCEEEFVPAELMNSQLINDEIAWAQEKATMPNVALSEEARKKAGVNNLIDASTSLAFDTNDTNFSMGSYFKMRSENLSNIVSHESGAARAETRQPVALVDDSVCKDSGNATTDTSYLLSISAIDRVLLDFNLQIESDDDTSIMVQRLLQEGQLEHTQIKDKLLLSSENKENINPEKNDNTLSFTESLLNNSHSKLLNNSTQKSEHTRLPLSPLQLADTPQEVPAICVSTESEVEADIDEWPSTPVVSPFRRRKLKKSPQSQQEAEKKQISNLCSTLLEEQPTKVSPKTSSRSCADLQPLPSRTVSRCSSNSEFTHREGKLVPLKVTSFELCWPSTKLRTNARKSMQVKNIANKRLAVRIDIQGPGFQIVNMPTSKILTMQSQECRSININFCPTVNGAAHGMLCFYAPNSQHQQVAPFLEIPLYGFGGHCRLVPHHVSRGPQGPWFISMGNICDLSHALEQQFVLCNTGTLPGFMSIAIDSVSLKFRGLQEAFTVRPQQCLIPCGESVTVSIVFQPKREDIKKISKQLTQQVLTLAQLRIISGDEPNRQRMRKLYGLLSAEERSKLQTSSLLPLWSEWPNEQSFGKQLRNLKEQPNVVFDLLTCMKVHEVALTLSADENLEETLDISSMYCPDADETILFRTVCAANSLHEEEQDLPEESELGACSEPSWSVSPSSVEFDFFAQRRKQRVVINVRNNYKSRQFFEVSCNHRHLLTFTPMDGYVGPEGGQVEIEIGSKYASPPNNLPKQGIMIMVYIENERITVPVKIPSDNYI